MTEASQGERKQVLWQNPKTVGKKGDQVAEIINNAEGLKILGDQGKALTNNLDDTQPAETAERLEQAKKLSKRVPNPKLHLDLDDLKD